MGEHGRRENLLAVQKKMNTLSDAESGKSLTQRTTPHKVSASCFTWRVANIQLFHLDGPCS